MEIEYGKSVSDKSFIENKDKIWVIILFLGIIAIIFGLCVDLGTIEIGKCINKISNADMRKILWEASGSICNIIVTYNTMLVAIVIFFYSISDNKRLGIPYRQLTAYTVGARTIPILFMTTFLVTVFMSVAHFISLKYTVYICIIYIFAIQVFVCIEIFLSTSYKHCKKVICRIEKKRYIAGKELKEEFNTEWAYFYGHLERAIHSEEFIPNKKELLIEFLWIPFNIKEKDKKKLTETEYLEKVYQFYFVNILSAFHNFNGDENHLERNQLYMCIKDFVIELADKCSTEMKSFHMILSGIMNGLVSSNVEDSNGFCAFILSKCIADCVASKRQLYLFVLFQEMLSMVDTHKKSCHLKIHNFRNWELIKIDDITFCADFWEIWGKMYDISFFNKMQHFDMAIQTMSGRRNMSVPISRMMFTMAEKDDVREKNNGKEYINKNTST